MMTSKITTILLLVIINGSIIYAQQIASFSSYYENGFMWNPALTARWNTWEVSCTARKDFVGFNGSPQSGSIAFQYPFIRRFTKNTIGAFVEYDNIGAFNTIGASGTYAYKIRPQIIGNNDDVLTFGMKGGFYQYRFSHKNIVPFELEIDPSLLPNSTSFIPDIGFGIFYNSVSDFYSYKSHYYFGFSFNRILPANIKSFLYQNLKSSPHATMHIGRRIFPHKSKCYIEPNAFVNYAFAKAINVMANFRYEMINKFWLSAGAVTNGEIFGQVGFILNNESFMKSIVQDGTLRIGAKVDYNLGKFGRYGGVGYEFYTAYLFSNEPY